MKRKSTLTSKWIKTQSLLRHKRLAGFVPETKLYGRTSLLAMLKKHRMVYVKPISGSGGQGVIRAERLPHARKAKYRYQLERKRGSFAQFPPFFHSLNRVRLRKPYLVQQGIPLLTYADRIFDVRVMVQRTAKRPWKATGYIGRLAHPGKIVTNYHSEGTPVRLETLLSPHVKGAKRREYRIMLQQLGQRIAEHLQKSHPNFRELGIDFAIDNTLKPWVLEVNTGPDVHIFKKLADKTMFHRVLRYSQANGRYLHVKRIAAAKGRGRPHFRKAQA